jgi:hypothetical protein
MDPSNKKVEGAAAAVMMMMMMGNTTSKHAGFRQVCVRWHSGAINLNAVWQCSAYL